MEMDDLRREGPNPAIIPNAGHRRRIYWMMDDVLQYVELLKKAFPGILFYESFSAVAELEGRPAVRFFDRLDDPTIQHEVCAFVPYPGWKAELIRKPVVEGSKRTRWTWSRYLSPRLSFPIFFSRDARTQGWRREPAAPKIEYWPSTDILTSYRSELIDERRSADKFVALARKLCIRTVPVRWESSKEFNAGAGKVSRGGFMTGDGWATPPAVTWCLSVPGRVLGFDPWASGGAHGCLPVERVPDAWWGDIPKPKWAQRP